MNKLDYLFLGVMAGAGLVLLLLFVNAARVFVPPLPAVESSALAATILLSVVGGVAVLFRRGVGVFRRRRQWREATVRRRAALGLYRAGWNISQVAAHLQVPRRRAWGLVRRAAEEERREGSGE